MSKTTRARHSQRLDGSRMEAALWVNRISLGYADTAANGYVAVSDVGSLRRDFTEAQELWHVEQRAYYPEGPGDERLCVLQVEIQRASTGSLRDVFHICLRH
jgi:general stress protein 26